MSDWQIDDYALCIDDRDNPYWGRSPLSKGAVYRVRYIYTDATGIGLFFREVESVTIGGFAAERFIKVTPDAETLEDRGLIALMNKEPNHVD